MKTVKRKTPQWLKRLTDGIRREYRFCRFWHNLDHRNGTVRRTAMEHLWQNAEHIAYPKEYLAAHIIDGFWDRAQMNEAAIRWKELVEQERIPKEDWPRHVYRIVGYFDRRWQHAHGTTISINALKLVAQRNLEALKPHLERIERFLSSDVDRIRTAATDFFLTIAKANYETAQPFIEKNPVLKLLWKLKSDKTALDCPHPLEPITIKSLGLKKYTRT